MTRRRIGVFLLPALCAAFAPPSPRPPAPARVAGPRTTASAAGRLRASSSPSDPDDGSSIDALDAIQSWLLGRLPDLPPAELELYSACLLGDGYSTPAQLDGINSGASGRVEDLYFMRKGHRLSLMKQIGGSGGNNGGRNRGRGEGATTAFTSTEVDGEFAIVEEFLADPRSDDGDARAEGDPRVAIDVERTTNPDLSIEEEIVFLQTNSGATLAGKGAVGEVEARDPPTSEDADAVESKGPAEIGPVESSREDGRAAPDHRYPGDTKRARSSDGVAHRSAASLSGEERCERPAASSGRDRATELGAVAGRLGNVARRTDADAHSRSPQPVGAASLSGEERCMRPAPSSGGPSDGYVTVDDRLGDARVSRRARANKPEDSVLDRAADSTHKVVRRSQLSDDAGDPALLGRGIESRNHAKEADKSPQPVSAAPLSRGEAIARPAPSRCGPSEGYLTVNDRTGDARVRWRTRVNKPKDSVLDRAADSTHKVVRRSLPSDDAGDPATALLDRAADSTHKVVRRSLLSDDAGDPAPSGGTERQSTAKAAIVPPKVLSRATSTPPSSKLAGLTRAADSVAPSVANKIGPNVGADESAEVSRLRTLAGGRPRGPSRGRKEEEPIHLRAAFEPSSLRSLLKK